MAIWEKFNPRERLSAIGAGLIILGFIVSLASYGVGAGTVALVGAIAVLAILYLKYAPNQNITWPVATSLLILGISGVVALLVLLDLLRVLGVLELLRRHGDPGDPARGRGLGAHAVGRLAGVPDRQAGDAELHRRHRYHSAAGRSNPATDVDRHPAAAGHTAPGGRRGSASAGLTSRAIHRTGRRPSRPVSFVSRRASTRAAQPSVSRSRSRARTPVARRPVSIRLGGPRRTSPRPRRAVRPRRARQGGTNPPRRPSTP